jgi:hypothetical protein
MTTDPEYHVGLDASGVLGSGWRGQLTVNTDFAQVDVDDQVVNLTRFGLFLPEKRDFFSKDQDLFHFGLPEEAQMLHTRRIGLREGRQVPVLSGLKVIGRGADWMRLGLMEVVTRPGVGDPWQSHLVARGRADMGGGSNVGWMMAHRQSLERTADRNMVMGLDGAYRGKRVPLLIESFGLMSITGADAGEPQIATGGAGVASKTGTSADHPATGGGVSAAWRGELVRPSVSYLYLHPELRADLGFFRRVGIHRWGADVGVEPRIRRFGLEKLTLEAGGNIVASGTGEAELLDWTAEGAASLYWNAGYSLGVVLDHRSELVEQAFTVGRNTTIPSATYEMLRVHLWAETPESRPVSGTAGVTVSDFYGGQLYGVVGYVSARPSSLVRMSVGASYDDVQFDDERPSFASMVLNGKLSFGFTRDLGLDLFVGWNRIEDRLLGNSRLRWTWAPGSDIFLVYQVETEDDFSAERFQSLLVKATWHWP